MPWKYLPVLSLSCHGDFLDRLSSQTVISGVPVDCAFFWNLKQVMVRVGQRQRSFFSIAQKIVLRHEVASIILNALGYLVVISAETVAGIETCKREVVAMQLSSSLPRVFPSMGVGVLFIASRIHEERNTGIMQFETAQLNRPVGEAV